ncbi:hypothetical protein G436_3379 [Leptospira interrogans serovar Hardjo str. Norma]|uniref:Uncharacterized protein n=1 Tax=Leptospira interrogans serovar Hardjo str. Norma TaxID=1279460 RepID=A0A0M4N7I6_LEPIR|nr:hypothetical protein G436_3379 [Leptospira interrogans serovar Hardjo str. Norma]
MPLGVEHDRILKTKEQEILLNITLMPLGVEHLITTGTLIAVAI